MSDSIALGREASRFGSDVYAEAVRLTGLDGFPKARTTDHLVAAAICLSVTYAAVLICDQLVQIKKELEKHSP